MSQLLHPRATLAASSLRAPSPSGRRSLRLAETLRADSAPPLRETPPPVSVGADAQEQEDSAHGAITPPEREVFEQALTARIGEHRFHMHFETGARVTCEPTRVRISTTTGFQADRMNRQLRGDLEAVAHELYGSAARIEITVDEALSLCVAADSAQPLPSSPPAPMASLTGGAWNGATVSAAPQRQRLRAAPREESFRRLDDFVVGDANRLAFSAADSFAQNSVSAPALLFLHGECGVGKTHLLQGICRRWSDSAPESNIRYATAEQFTNEYIAAVRAGTLDDFRRRIRKLDLLAIDDVHFFASKNATQTEFLHTIDAIALSGARLALVSDEHPRQIKRFSESLISRFLSGMVVRLDRPDRATRLALVRRLASVRDLALRPCAEERLVSRCAGSVREIEGAIARLVAAAHLDGVEQAITGTLADRMLGDEFTNALPSAPIRLSRIIDAVVQRLGIPRDEILNQSRHQRATRARGVVAHLARQLTSSSYPEIARALGRNAHSCVHAGAKLVEQLLRDDEPLIAGVSTREAIDQLRHDLVRGG